MHHQQEYHADQLRTDILYDNDSSILQLRVPTLPQHLASHLSVDYHPLSEEATSDAGEFEDEPVPLLPTESADLLKAERQALANTIRDYAPFRARDSDVYTTNGLEDFAHNRIREIDKKLAFRASPLQRIKQHTTVVEQLTGRLNDIEG